MPLRHHLLLAITVAMAVTATVTPRVAWAYDELVVFGDSLSDNGNFYNAIFRIAPSKPYYEGRFSSGPVAVEVMAGLLGIPLVDQAFGGASSGIDNRYLPGTGTGLRGQVDSYLTKLSAAGKAADPADLYVVWGGGNDLLDEITEGRSDAIPAVIDTTVSNLAGSVSALYQAGARDLLLPLMPDMATSFYGTSGQYATSFLSQVSASFNDALRARMSEVAQASPGLTLRVFDTPAVLQGVRAQIASSGGNVVDRCWSGEYIGRGTLCANPDAYFLFDRVHPTAIVHRAVGTAMAAAVPEPATWGLALLGACLAGGMARRRGRRQVPVACVTCASPSPRMA